MKNIFFIVCTLFFFAGCSANITTPAIEGTVIDKVTKQPVENAWIMTVAKIATHNPGGKVVNSYLLNKPHTRTDKEGRFFIPSNKYGGLGAQFSQLRIDVYAPEGKRGALDIDMEPNTRPNNPVKQDAETIIKPSTSLKEKNLSVMIPVKETEITMEETNEELSRLSTYCEMGRYYYAWPIVKGACGPVEAGYLITANESLANKLGKPKNIDNEVMYWGIQTRLGYLFKQTGNYQKALDIFRALNKSYKEKGLTIGVYEQESQIKELQQKLQEK
jgi:hypothetical protein